MPANDDERETRQPPIYWFVLLTEALGLGDYTAAAHAAEQLRAARIDVRICQPQYLQEAGNAP